MIKNIAVFVLCALACTAVYAKNTQKGISNGVIRFHVLANSDSDTDQSLKIKVRDGILSDFEDKLSAAETRQQTIDIITDNIEDIEISAEKTLLKNGCAYPVNAKVSRDYFPTKQYGDVNLPAGEYDTLRIEIGEAKGHNWWCVMFPPLCYVDVTRCSIPDDKKTQLAQNMTDEEYKLITGDTTDVKVRFKIVEIWEEIEALF